MILSPPPPRQLYVNRILTLLHNRGSKGKDFKPDHGQDSSLWSLPLCAQAQAHLVPFSLHPCFYLLLSFMCQALCQALGIQRKAGPRPARETQA